MAIIRSFRDLRPYQDLDSAWQSIGGMIANMIIKADDFCKNAR
jgi:hypothetical protein